jgi:hypothetical protein
VTILGKTIPAFLIVAMLGMGTAAAITGYLLLTSTSTVTITESMTLYWWNGAWQTFGTLPAIVTLGPLNLYPGTNRIDYFAAKNDGGNPIIIKMDITGETIAGFSASLVCDGSTGYGSGVKFIQASPGIWYIKIPGGSAIKSIGIDNVVDPDAGPVTSQTFQSFTYRGSITVAAFDVMAYTTCP